MRGYALLLGITLTIGYGYAGQVALTSVQAANRHASLAGRADWPPDALYYGGTLAPITVEATGTEGAHTVVTVPLAHKVRSEEHTSELQSRLHLVCRLLLG